MMETVSYTHLLWGISDDKGVPGGSRGAQDDRKRGHDKRQDA